MTFAIVGALAILAAVVLAIASFDRPKGAPLDGAKLAQAAIVAGSGMSLFATGVVVILLRQIRDRLPKP